MYRMIKASLGPQKEGDFRGRFKLEAQRRHGARPVVQGVLDSRALCLRGAEVHAFGEVFTDEAIGILIGAALPRAGGSQKKTSMYSRLAKVSC